MTCNKTAYTKKDARAAINRRMRWRTGNRHNRPDLLRAYQCPQCNWWHLTHHAARVDEGVTE